MKLNKKNIKSPFSPQKLSSNDPNDKEYIRRLMAKDYYNGIDYLEYATVDNLIEQYHGWIERYKNHSILDKIHKITLVGYGKGELLFYFIFNNITLGGPGEKHGDLFLDGTWVELKSLNNKEFKPGIKVNSSRDKLKITLEKFAYHYNKITGQWPPNYKTKEGQDDQSFIDSIGGNTIDIWRKIKLKSFAGGLNNVNLKLTLSSNGKLMLNKKKELGYLALDNSNTHIITELCEVLRNFNDHIDFSDIDLNAKIIDFEQDFIKEYAPTLFLFMDGYKARLVDINKESSNFKFSRFSGNGVWIKYLGKI